VRRGGELVGAAPEAGLDPLEQLRVGGIDEVLGHLAEGLRGGGSEPAHDRAGAGFTALGGR
jgi:hypothetical protein